MHVSDNTLSYVLKLSKPVDDSLLQPEKLRYFDKDGFELTPLELALYKQHKIPLGEHLYHHCSQLDWIVQEDTPKKGVVVDHSMLLHRYSVSGDLRLQIFFAAKHEPIFQKLLAVHEKWGLDISLDYLDEQGVTELFHTEIDSREREDVQAMKERLERFVMSTDWEDVAKEFRARRAEWEQLSADDQNDWRCRFLGFNRAYLVKKVW
jgi:hypothetical protein